MSGPRPPVPISNLQTRALVHGQKHGPCTIYDLRRAFGNQDIEGGVFRPGLWVRVGYVVAEAKKSKGDSVAVWVPKSWLARHSVNGKNLAMSAFSFDRIYLDTVHRMPAFNRTTALWIIGTDNLADEYRAKRKILKIPTSYRLGCTGALLVTNSKEAPKNS